MTDRSALQPTLAAPLLPPSRFNSSYAPSERQRLCQRRRGLSSSSNARPLPAPPPSLWDGWIDRVGWLADEHVCERAATDRGTSHITRASCVRACVCFQRRGIDCNIQKANHMRPSHSQKHKERRLPVRLGRSFGLSRPHTQGTFGWMNLARSLAWVQRQSCIIMQESGRYQSTSNWEIGSINSEGMQRPEIGVMHLILSIRAAMAIRLLEFSSDRRRIEDKDRDRALRACGGVEKVIGHVFNEA